MYSYFDLNTITIREMKMCMISSCIYISTRIQLRQENRRYVWYLQVFSFRLEYITIREKDICYDIFMYSHFNSNIIIIREKKLCTLSSCILISTRINYDKRTEDMYDIFIRFEYNYKEKRGHVWCLQVFSLNIRIIFDKEKRGHVWCLQVFTLILELSSTKRNEAMYDIFRYSYQYLNYLRQRETRTCMMSSGILINIRIIFDKKKRE
jgi:hypothetical protein